MSAALALVKEDNTHTHLLPRAAEMRDRARVRALLANGANVDAPTESGMTPLMFAASNGSAEIVEILLDRGAQVNTKRNDGLTAIDLAAFFGQLGVVHLLLRRRADPEVRGRVGTSAETWATVRGFVDIAETLRQASECEVTYSEPGLSVSPGENRPVQDESGNDFYPNPQLRQQPSANGEIGSAASPVTPDVTLAASSEESAAIESSLPAAVAVDSVHQREHAVTQSTTRGSQTASEAPKRRATTPQFRPGLVFLERITSSWRHLIMLTLAVMIVCGGATYGMLRTNNAQISTTGVTTFESVSPATETPKSTNSAGSNTANQLEPGSDAIAVKASASQVSEAKPDPSARMELAHGLNSRTTPQQKPEPHAFAFVSNQTYKTPPRKVATESSPKRRDYPSTRILSVSNPNSDTTPTAGSAGSKLMPASEDEPKPAPLSVSVSRTRSINAVPSNNDARVDQALPPLSTRPKRKVIQWP
ncbi:MAG: ankyrin repeat domain-containing protein [Pyrinomonadaceae bacterium]